MHSSIYKDSSDVNFRPNPSEASWLKFFIRSAIITLLFLILNLVLNYCLFFLKNIREELKNVNCTLFYILFNLYCKVNIKILKEFRVLRLEKTSVWNPKTPKPHLILKLQIILNFLILLYLIEIIIFFIIYWKM